jgi:endonuclease/exonuclease/phosphatase family metal-dependent hydrolase
MFAHAKNLMNAKRGTSMKKRKGHSPAYVLVCLVSVLLVFGCNPCNDTDGIIQNVNGSAFAGPGFTVVTFNMLHGFGDAVNDATLDDRLDILAQEIIAAQPDAVLLQEASVTMPAKHCNVIETLATRVNEELSYNSVYARANGSADLIGFEEGSAVLSRHEIIDAEVHVYTYNATSLPETRIALRVTIRGDGGKNIDLLGTHLTNLEDMVGDDLARTLQARELVQDIIPGRPNSNPVVVGGDFNDPPGSDTYLELTGAGLFEDLFASENPGVDGFTSFGGGFDITDPAEEAVKRIDYLFMMDGSGSVTGSELFLDAARDIDPDPGNESWLWASDHIGVKATFQPSGY